jgi:hypothetical protein
MTAVAALRAGMHADGCTDALCGVDRSAVAPMLRPPKGVKVYQVDICNGFAFAPKSA